VAAAMEAAIQGIPGVAVSLDVLTVNEAEASLREAMAKAAAFGRRAAEVVLARSLPAHALLNINVPGEVSGPPKITRLGRRHYGKEVIERQDPRGKKYYWIGGARAEYADIPGSDCNALLEGRISITPLRLELSAEDLIPALEGWGF
jgi:5'-nucleotidase